MICYHWRNYAVRNVHFIFFYDFILEGKLYLTIVLTDRASPVAQMVKILPATQETWIQSLCWEDPWAREMATTPALLSEEIHGQRSLMGCNPWGGEESDATD